MRVRLLLFFALACLLPGCSRAVPPPGAATVLEPPRPHGVLVQNTTTGRNWITAAPDRTALQAGAATMTVTWAAPGYPSAQIRLSLDGSAEKIFAGGLQFGSARASFILTGHTYVFRLYASPAGRRALASAVVGGR